MADACVFRRRFDGRARSIDVYHNPLLDGGGTWLAEPFVQLLRRERRSLGTVFEFCAGPGFIAFALLADGLAHAAVLADVNPIAVECARKTVRENQLSDRVRVHLANGTRGLPASERGRFDTVVTDWPNYEHFQGTFRRFFSALDDGDLRGEDPGWRLHREFYSGIRRFLAPGARMYIEEVRPMDRLVHHCVIRSTDGVWVRSKEPCDERSAAPLPLFASMIADGGLRLIQTLPWVDERSRLVPAHRREGLREAVSWILVVAAAEPARRRGDTALVEGPNL